MTAIVVNLLLIVMLLVSPTVFPANTPMMTVCSTIYDGNRM